MKVVREGDEFRQGRFKKGKTTEMALALMNQMLAPVERRQISAFVQPKKPTVFVVGVYRSGTTLASQVLVNGSQFGYITNWTARFWMAPYIGTKLGFKLGTAPLDAKPGFRSDIGEARGMHESHEFKYFWERYFFCAQTSRAERYGNAEELAQEVAALEEAFGMPMLFRHMWGGQNAQWLEQALPNAKFVFIHRDLRYTAQSMLLARRKMFGRDDVWWPRTGKPSNYAQIQALPPIERIAAQVGGLYMDTRRETFGRQVLDVSYLDVCKSPRTMVQRVCEWLDMPFDVKHLPESFGMEDVIKIPRHEWDVIESVVKEFAR